MRILGVGFLTVTILCSSTACLAASEGPTDKDMKQGQKNAKAAQQNAQATAEYHFSLAQAYSTDGDPDKAIEEYKLTLIFDPNSALVHTRLATEYVKKGMLSAAMETCKEGLQRDPKYIDAHLILAGLYSTSHETKAALDEYDKVLKLDPKHEEAIVYKAQVLVEDGKSKQAVLTLRQFAKKNSESSVIWYYLGRIEQQDDHFKEAVVAFRKAMELRSGFTQAALALGYLYEEKQKNAEAIKIYKTLFEEGRDLSAASRLATIFLKEEKYQSAIPYLQFIQQSDPDDMNVRVKLGLVQMELKNFDESERIFKSILEKNPDADRIHFYLGSVYEEKKDVNAAVKELSLVKPDSKLYGDAALHAGILLKGASRNEEAKTLLKDAIRKSPRNSRFYLLEASIEEETKDLPGAIKTLEKASQEFPEDEKVHYYLGSIYDRVGEVDKGLAQMEIILKINPENVDAMNYIGYTWTQKGVRLNDAEKLIKRALGLRPDNGYIQDSWGWYLYMRGRLKEAVVELEKAARMKPNESTILEHLGDAYLRANLREKALNHYSDAMRYAEDADSRRKIQIKADNLRKELVEEKTPKDGPGSEDRMPASSH